MLQSLKYRIAASTQLVWFFQKLFYGTIKLQWRFVTVFDDGDITTLKRTALCLKSGRHFNESETLDQLPLTHPEHFGNPVVGGRRGRRNRHLKFVNEISFVAFILYD